MLRLGDLDPAITALFDGTPHGPSAILSGEKAAEGGIAPDWLIRALAESGMAGPEAGALLDRAPLDIRVNTLKADRATITLPAEALPTDAPQGLRLMPGTSIENWDAYLDGLIEVQDTGSQLACLAVEACPGETVVDLCAGAGGKTLALAAAMENRGTLIAADTDRQRLSRLLPRANRAGAGMIETQLLDPGRELAMLSRFAARSDAALVDAPCSGTGTWRRNPEARWRLTPERLARFAEVQSRLLDIAADLVRPGGRLVYVVCSLLDIEGAGQVDRFLADHPEWTAEPANLPLGRAHGKGWRLSPFHDGTDGFFIASLSRAC